MTKRNPHYVNAKENFKKREVKKKKKKKNEKINKHKLESFGTITVIGNVVYLGGSHVCWLKKNITLIPQIIYPDGVLFSTANGKKYKIYFFRKLPLKWNQKKICCFYGGSKNIPAQSIPTNMACWKHPTGFQMIIKVNRYVLFRWVSV